jgi:hypothetical protein
MNLAEAWFEIARLLARNEHWWICNAANDLFRKQRISASVRADILARVYAEAKRQGRGHLGHSLWAEYAIESSEARVARIRFIAAELRRLAGGMR